MNLSSTLSVVYFFFFSSRRRHTRLQGDWSSDVCSSDLDSAGTFQLPAFQKRYRVAWLIPNFDPAVPTYSLCAGADTIRTAYHGYGSLGDLAPPRDSLSCLEWTWLGRARVTCSGSVERAVVTRGRWVAGEASGWYRIISVVEQRRPHDRPQDRKSTRLNSSHLVISYAVFCLKKKKNTK